MISARHKGFPIAAHGQTIEKFLASKPNLFTSGFQFPVMALKESALNHNIDLLASYCKGLNVLFAPHAKTPMAPQLVQRQANAGAWALTVANYFQANVFLDFGFKRIFIANEVVEPTSIADIAKRNGVDGVEIFFYLDSLVGFKIAKDAIVGMPHARLDVFLEIGDTNGRAGIRTLEGVKELVEEIQKDSRFKIRGVTGFEGAFAGIDRIPKEVDPVRNLLRKIVAAAQIVAPYLGNQEIILSAGGTSFFDYVVEEFSEFKGPLRIVLRSGAYITNDLIGYEKSNPFVGEPEEKRLRPAMEIWSRVLSIPESNLAILNFGKRDAGNDVNNPSPIKRYIGEVTNYAATIEKLNDQHAYMNVTQPGLSVGDIIGCGITHPCTNFDKWRLLPIVNAQYDVIDCIHTFF
ncbi:unannotated protein [freshwater metagenome]|uniref:Unannotated protein n=1 Tax=freshwater metagenome TaxID=449393 RepID=A0A6J6M651_9ZZZZ